MLKVKLRKVPKCSLEYADGEFRTWLDNYISELITKSELGLSSSSRIWAGASRETQVSRKETMTIYWDPTDSKLDFSPSEDSFDELESDQFCYHRGCSFVYNVQEDCLARSSFIMESMPLQTYLKLAPIFGLDENKRPRLDGTSRCKITDHEAENQQVKDFIHLVATEIGFKSQASEDEQVDVGTLRNSLRNKPKNKTVDVSNPYYRFFKREGPGTDDAIAKYNLARRSKEITRSIISEFLAWVKSIEGDDEETTIDETVLQDLFQIGFDSPTARAIALRIKEMPVVPESLAELRNEPQFAISRALKQLIKNDIRLEEMPPKLFAFGRMLPKEAPCLRFQPPKTNTKKTWTECERVPHALESMKVVWEGIENLRSTVAFSNWLQNHPAIPFPGYLKEKGLADINYEEWMQIFKGFEKEVKLSDPKTETKFPGQHSATHAASMVMGKMGDMSSTVFFRETSSSGNIDMA